MVAQSTWSQYESEVTRIYLWKVLKRKAVTIILELHHLSIISSSEASVSFYKLLGFKEFYRKHRNYDDVILMTGHGIRLEIFVDPDHPQRSNKPECLGIRFFSLKVDNIESTIKELNLKAGPIMTDWVGERYCFISDPDGLPIQLHE